MKILFVGSEAAPFVKTGGLGDVLGALPAEMLAMGHDARLILPFYSSIDIRRFPCRLLVDGIRVHLPAGTRRMSLWELQGAPGGVTVYLVKDDGFFARFGIYDEQGREYADNALRFSYFCMSVFWVLKSIGWFPDIFHCHDWPTSMISTYLSNLTHLRDDPDFAHSRTLLTIHNLAYQGVCPSSYIPLLGLRYDMLNAMELEFFGRMNLLKGGLVYSDALSTVSRRYAQEIQTTEFGCGLEGVLRHRSRQLYGIMNGIDTAIWNPETDPLIPARYGIADLSGKAECKAALQAEFGLPQEPGRPLLAVVSRIVEQKGFDLIAQSMPRILATGAQYLMLGRGMEKYERMFQEFAAANPSQMSVRIDYSEPLAHKIEAGADIYLMPSRFEPCGLNQLYSLRYGTIPVVHKIGGLADSVTHTTDERIESGEATGFTFSNYAAEPFFGALEQAINLYRERPDAWRRIMGNAMRRDFSWHHSALEYERVMGGLMPGGGGVAAGG